MRTLLVVSLLVAATPATADVDSPLVKRGVAAYDALDYERAISLLESARAESLTREEKIVTARTLGMAYVAIGKTVEARAEFERLLHADPAASLDRAVAPKVRAVFEEAKAAAVHPRSGSVTALPALSPTVSPAAPGEGRALTVQARYRGGVARRMTVYFRRSGDPGYSHVTVEGSDGTFAATIPGTAVVAPALEYHAVLLDESGASLAAAGSLGQPLVVEVARKKAPPRHKRAWVWGLVGGVAAAGALATGLALGLPHASSTSVTVNPQ